LVDRCKAENLESHSSWLLCWQSIDNANLFRAALIALQVVLEGDLEVTVGASSFDNSLLGSCEEGLEGPAASLNGTVLLTESFKNVCMPDCSGSRASENVCLPDCIEFFNLP
jgi:hypothetical protein